MEGFSTNGPARLLGILLCAALFSMASGVHDPETFVYQEYQLTRPFYSNGGQLANWDYYGSTVITENYIRLTPDRQGRKGGLWNKRRWKSGNADSSFEIVTQFQVHGQGKKLFGDGFALWYTQETGSAGPVFGNHDNFIGMAIFFDTYSNVKQSHQQYVSVMINDGTRSYRHEEDGGAEKLAGCHASFRGPEGYAKVVYENKILRVYLDLGTNTWEECFVVRQVTLPTGWHFGVTAETGDLADNHDILMYRVSDPSPMTAEEQKTLNDRIAADIADGVTAPVTDPQYADETASSSSIVWLAVILTTVIVVIGVVMALKGGRRPGGPALPM